MKSIFEIMRHLLRLEHWIIQTFKFDRMTNNLLWLIIVVWPLILGLMLWLLLLHERPDTQYILSHDPELRDKIAEVEYIDGTFYFNPEPFVEQVLLNYKPLRSRVQLQENDQVVIGHTIFQVRQLHDWTPHFRTIGYYAADRDLHAGASVGRSIHPEELNNWAVNDIIVRDRTLEPVHFMLFPAQQGRYRLKNVGRKGVYVQSARQDDEPPGWTHITEDTLLQPGQRVHAGHSTFELVPIPSQEALALKIVHGVRPTYELSRDARTIIGGLQIIPKAYIPDYLVDEEFLEYVRQSIEQGLLSLAGATDTLRLRVKGFDATGKLVEREFAPLSEKERFLLHKIFRFREQPGAALRWRRPFNREAEDSYRFYPDQTENFVIDAEANQLKDIYQYAARLTNPHTIAAELATERGNIYDRDRYSHARLWAYTDPQQAPVAELLLAPSTDPQTVLPFNTGKAADSIVYAAGGYRFSGGTSVVYEQGAFYKVTDNQKIRLRDRDTFTDRQYTFLYAAPGKGLLARNIVKNDRKRRYYPLGSRLAHLIGYSYAHSQFKGNLEKVFDKVLLSTDEQKPWWSLERTTERVPGNHLILTIDDDLQRVVYAELRQKLTALNQQRRTNQFRGAAIVLNADGEILASATLPSYNPNNLESILTALRESEEDHWNSAYINRATHKRYPPGSTMKVVMSTIALDNKAKFLIDIGDGQYKIRDGDRPFVCTGYLSSFRGHSFGRYGIPDFGGASHGALTLDTAVARSCNNTFAFLALNAGWQTIQTYAERYGFNQQFDFLPYQMFQDDIQLVSHINRSVNDPLASLASLVPTPKGGELKLSQLARMGIGQWEILATPLQMATIAMTVGNLGQRPYPHLIRGIHDPVTTDVRWLPYPQRKRVFEPGVMAELIPMMQHVVQRGSGVRMARSTIPYYSLKDHVAGKTGTAEVEDQRGRKTNVVWFISFAPAERPQLAIAVVIEKGSIISGEAVEVARGIWEKAVLLYPELFQQRNVAATSENHT